MKGLLFNFGVLILLGLSSCGTNNAADDKNQVAVINLEAITGNYTYGDILSEKGGGYLAMQLIDSTHIKFEIDLNGGAPKYHSGTASGIATLDQNKASWGSTEFTNNPCSLTFTIEEDKVLINQEEGTDSDCGFGVGVVATGEYRKQSGPVKFPHEEEIVAALKNVLESIDGTYQTNTDPEGTLIVQKIDEATVKIKYYKNAENAIEGAAKLENNIATLAINSCQLTFTFLANEMIEIAAIADEKESCTLPDGLSTDIILTKMGRN